MLCKCVCVYAAFLEDLHQMTATLCFVLHIGVTAKTRLNTVYCQCACFCSIHRNSKCVRAVERTTGSGLLTRVVQCLRDVLMHCVNLLMGEPYQTSYNRGQEFSDIFLRVSRVD